MKRLLLLLPIAFLPACVPVRVAVPDPVKIDVNMKVDVTTRNEGAVAAAPGAPAANGPATGTGTSTNAPAAGPAASTPAGADLHKLSGELQSFKNDRLIGENDKGYLEVRQEPDGKLASGESYSAYVDRLVKEANDDRKELYAARAEKSGDPIETHELQAAQRRRDAAFAGEWIQMADGTWKQK